MWICLLSTDPALSNPKQETPGLPVISEGRIKSADAVELFSWRKFKRKKNPSLELASKQQNDLHLDILYAQSIIRGLHSPIFRAGESQHFSPFTETVFICSIIYILPFYKIN